MISDPERIERCFISRYWKFIFVSADELPRSLCAALELRIPHIDPESWPGRLRWGGAYVNGRPAREEMPLPLPCQIEYYEPRFRIEDAHSFFPSFKPEYVLYRDEFVAVVFKPAGLPAMPAREQLHFNIKSYLDRHFGTTVHMPSRLDLSTAGVLAVSLSPRTHRAINRAYEKRVAEKTYLLESAAPVTWERQVVELPIGRDPQHPVLRMPHGTNARAACTEFARIGQDAEGSGTRTLIAAKPHTGRTHQIRVHAAYSGFPIVGDNFYGGAPEQALRLLSYRLRLPHPISGRRIEVTVPDELLPEWAGHWRGSLAAAD